MIKITLELKMLTKRVEIASPFGLVVKWYPNWISNEDIKRLESDNWLPK